MVRAFSMKQRRLSHTTWGIILACVVIALFVVGFAVNALTAPLQNKPHSLNSLVDGLSASDAIEGKGSNSADSPVVAEPSPSALDAASATDAVNVFDASAGTERTLDAAEIPEVQKAVAAFGEAGYEVGFVVYDLQTQRGMGYNADGGFFSASTVKAPFVAYVVQDEVGEGSASLDEELFEDVVVDGTGIMASDDVDTYRLEEVLTNAIEHSDNTGYALLRERFDNGGFEAWCAAAGVDAAAWEGEWYPYCTPRDLAKLWLSIGSYIADAGEYSAWCEALFLQTDSSFLRKALGGTGAVLSKPGYEIDTPWLDTISALNDAGVVLSGNGAYVVAIMSDVDYDDEYFTDDEYLIVDLASALGDAHNTLLSDGAAKLGTGANVGARLLAGAGVSGSGPSTKGIIA